MMNNTALVNCDVGGANDHGSHPRPPFGVGLEDPIERKAVRAPLRRTRQCGKSSRQRRNMCPIRGMRPDLPFVETGTILAREQA